MSIKFSAFDVPATMKVLLEEASRLQVIECADVVALTIEFGDDWAAMATEIITWAHNSRHHSPSLHATLCPLFDKVTAEMSLREGS